jgi:tetratricopeptide (TPR) repeat protein
MLRRALALAVVAFALLGAADARADARTDLEKARASYLARNYAEAEERLRALLDPQTGVKERTLLSPARMYLGAVHYAQGRKDAAKEIFEKLVLEDPTFEPDPLSFPGDVVNLYIDTRAQLAESIKNAAAIAAKLEAERKAREAYEREQKEKWLERVKALAQEDKTTVKNRRLVAFMPFGAGQFQNRQPVLGFVFLGVEASLVVTSGILFGMQRYAQTRAEEERDSLDLDQKKDQYMARADDLFIANIAVTGAFVLVAGAGILQANIAYVPEYVEVKKRELPPLSALRPVVAPTSSGDGVYLGVRGLVF